MDFPLEGTGSTSLSKAVPGTEAYLIKPRRCTSAMLDANLHMFIPFSQVKGTLREIWVRLRTLLNNFMDLKTVITALAI
jgi:hypothetical protein